MKGCVNKEGCKCESKAMELIFTRIFSVQAYPSLGFTTYWRPYASSLTIFAYSAHSYGVEFQDVR